MDGLTFWTSISILSAAIGGGFLYLMRGIHILSKEVEANKLKIEQRPEHNVVAAIYARKDVLAVTLENINKSIKDVACDIKEIKEKVNGK